MFDRELSPRFWQHGDRRRSVASVGVALLGHLALIAVLLLVTTRAPTPEAEATNWFALGLPGPGGGTNLFAAPGNPGQGGPGAETPPEEPEEEPIEELPEEVEPLVTPELAAVPRTLTEADSIAARMAGAHQSPGAGGLTAGPGGVGGEGGGLGGGSGGGLTGGIGGGQGGVRPLHLVVPRIPEGVDEGRARGQSVRLLIEVLHDGTVGEVRVEKGSRFAALDSVAVRAARGGQFIVPAGVPDGVELWTRYTMQF
jgi:TonB family protein